MSPNVGNFVHDLVEMAKAMETLPQVQAELEATRNMANEYAELVGKREASILDLKAQIDALNEKVRQSEVAKDAAETMFLEADDRTSRALAFVKATFGNAGALIQALEPPRVQPTTEPVPMQAVRTATEVAEDTAKDVGQSASDPITANAPPQPTWTGEEASGASPVEAMSNPPMHEAQLEGTKATGWEPNEPYHNPHIEAPTPPDATPPQGQSESPLPPSNATSESVPSQVSVNENVIPTADVQSPQTKPQPYVGLRYYDHPTYVGLNDWLAGGGTYDDYFMRVGRSAE